MIKRQVTEILNTLWYSKGALIWCLWPFSWIYIMISKLRRSYLLYYQPSCAVPIVVVGNLTLGGTGKTPLVIALAQAMHAKGLRVGIVTRGYKARIKSFPYQVSLSDNASLVGDEALLIAQKTACPVIIAPKRMLAVKYLLQTCHSQIIISDDGLQHYAMPRALEIVVIDGARGLGNQLCLPAGPLRENSKRLRTVDLVVINSQLEPRDTKSYCCDAHLMFYQPQNLINIVTGKEIALLDFQHLTMPVAAVAGIGNPQGFFTTLQKLGIAFTPYPFADHHNFLRSELQFHEKIIVMTEKDAVKCKSFAEECWYFLPVAAKLSDSFWKTLWSNKNLHRLI